MWRKALWAVGCVAGVLLAAPSLRAQGNYLNVSIVKLKPEKAAEVEALARKIADVNRHNNGDHLLAMETLYGEGYTYVFVTQRQDFADVDKGRCIHGRPEQGTRQTGLRKVAGRLK